MNEGADVNHFGLNTDMAVCTALMLTSSKSLYSETSSMLLIKSLLKGGAHVNKRNAYGQNALELFISRQRQFETPRHDVAMILYAAGETVTGTTVTN